MENNYPFIPTNEWDGEDEEDLSLVDHLFSSLSVPAVLMIVAIILALGGTYLLSQSSGLDALLSLAPNR